MLTLLLALQDHSAPGATVDDHGHAAEHASVLDAANWLPGVTALIVFGIAFFVLATRVWPKITAALDERDRKIREEIAAAEQAREQAKAALAEYERNLAQAREEASRMIARAKADAKAAGEELRARNQADLIEMKGRATREIESAKRAAIAELHSQAASLASAIAGKILQREITIEDQQRLVDESLRELTTTRGSEDQVEEAMAR